MKRILFFIKEDKKNWKKSITFRNDNIYKIFYPGSRYELSVYLLALFIGFFNVVKDSVFNNVLSFLLITFLLFLLIIFSKRVRDLGWLLFKAIK